MTALQTDKIHKVSLHFRIIDQQLFRETLGRLNDADMLMEVNTVEQNIGIIATHLDALAHLLNKKRVEWVDVGLERVIGIA